MTTTATFDLGAYMAENFTQQEIEDSKVIARLTAAMEMDENFADQFCQQNTLETAYEFCKNVVQTSMEEFQRIYTQFEADMTALMYKDEATGELKDEVLDLVAGGRFHFGKIGHMFKVATDWVKKNADYIKAGAQIVVGVAGIVGGIVTCATGGCAPAGAAAIMGGALTLETGIENMVKAYDAHHK